MVVAIAVDDVGVEARRGPDGLLEAGRRPGDEAVQALLVDDGRDPEPRLLDEEVLDRVRGLRDFGRPEVGRARQPGDLTHTIASRGSPVVPRRIPTR